MKQPEAGSWVLVWGQVLSREDERTHPEDAPIQIESHSEQYIAHVRLDRIEIPGENPPWIRRCTSLLLRDENGNEYLRCELHEGHSKAHTSDGCVWVNLGAAGNIEEG